jgi:NitT/TauT family transport system substrate-binding protein
MISVKALIGVGVAAAVFAVIAPLQAQEKVKIGLAVPKYGPLAAVYVADELGYYKEIGVQVDITAYRGGPAANQALAAGEADLIDYFPPGVALAVQKGLKEKIVGAAQVAANGWHLVVLKDSPIKSLKDLVGKKIGVTAKGSTTDFFALWAGKQAGGNVQTIPVGPGGLIPGLKGKQLDAAVLFSPLANQMIARGEGRSVADLAKDVGPSLPDVWVASQAFIDQRPKVLEGVLGAIYKATKYLQQNRSYAMKYLKEFTGESNDTVVRLEYEDAVLGRATSARIAPEWLKASMDLAAGSGIAVASPEAIVTDKFFHVKAD